MSCRERCASVNGPFGPVAASARPSAEGANIERLRTSDLRALLATLERTYAVLTLDDFTRHATLDLTRVVPADIMTYNEINLRRRRVAWVIEPTAARFQDDLRLFQDHLHELPFIPYFRRKPDGPAVKISDFLTLRQFRNLGLYSDFYRHTGMQHVMGINVSAPPLIAGLGALRSRSDFTERDRTLLNLLRPHLVHAYNAVETANLRQQEIELLLQGYEHVGRGVVLLGSNGRVESATNLARRWLAEYFGGVRMNRLPQILAKWARRQELPTAKASEPPRPHTPLVVARDGRRLVTRLLLNGSRRLLLFDEKVDVLPAERLESLGLSRREAQVLSWVVEGKSNVAIGTILGLSARTVQHTLERVYRKLDVETRTAATACALKGLGVGPL